MNFAEQIKDFSCHQASRMIVELLTRVSDERLIQLTYLGEKLTSDEEVLRAIRRVRSLLVDPTHPAREMFHRVLEYLPPENQATIFHTLFPFADQIWREEYVEQPNVKRRAPSRVGLSLSAKSS
jgi:hypothetical protein